MKPPRAHRAVPGGWRRLGTARRDAWFARRYWAAALVLVGAATYASAARFGRAGVAALAVLVVAYWLRYRVGEILRRVLVAVIVVVWLLAATEGVPEVAPIALAALAATMVVYRHVGSLRPRLIGVPRPESVLEPWSVISRTDDDAVRLVDALDELWGSTRPGGPRRGRRPVHRHGSGAEGTFAPAEVEPEARVDLFCGPDGKPRDPLAAIVRFSNASGALHRDDSTRALHGMAVRIVPVGGGAPGMDLVLADARRFPVATTDDFFGFLRRFGHWARLIPFAALGRSRFVALARMVPILRPASYVTRRYHGVNTFCWRGAPVRFLAKPHRGPRGRVRSGDRRWRLDRDLRDRLQQDEPIRFDLLLVRGRGLPERVQLDARRAWPWWMPSWRLGTLSLTDYVEAESIDQVGFDPFRLPAGVEPSADEILLARRAAYPESRQRRCPLETGGPQVAPPTPWAR